MLVPEMPRMVLHKVLEHAVLAAEVGDGQTH